MKHGHYDTNARANILGVGVHAIDMDAAVRIVEQSLKSGAKRYVCVTSVHGLIEAQHDSGFAAILGRALLVTPDGMPLVWMGRLQGHSTMSRVFGPDLMFQVCKMGIHSRTAHFLCGGRPGVAQQLKGELERTFPGIRIVGAYTPPFRELNSHEQAELISAVRELKPDIVWVGLGTPKQERFMARYLPLLDTRLMIGVGAAFDFHTGRIKDSPVLVKRCGLQWLHRLLQEPSRLWKRYLFSNSEFLIKIAQQLADSTRYTLKTSESDPSHVN
jgi:N-acetylglucosaminyldiphosphoundecaprenol N-acetyl-beta-D-mannosaminyltransferase